MKRLASAWLELCAASHQNKLNQKIHLGCIPFFFFGSQVWLFAAAVLIVINTQGAVAEDSSVLSRLESKRNITVSACLDDQQRRIPTGDQLNEFAGQMEAALVSSSSKKNEELCPVKINVVVVAEASFPKIEWKGSFTGTSSYQLKVSHVLGQSAAKEISTFCEFLQEKPEIMDGLKTRGVQLSWSWGSSVTAIETIEFLEALSAALKATESSGRVDAAILVAKEDGDPFAPQYSSSGPDIFVAGNSSPTRITVGHKSVAELMRILVSTYLR